MLLNEYGNQEKPIIILLPPMMVSGSNLYDLMSPYFIGSYHIIAPDMGGHGKAGAYRLFLDPDFTVHHAWFDGVALMKIVKIVFGG